VYDALTIAAIVDDLAEQFDAARVQRIYQVDPLTVVLQLYTGRAKWLLASADPQAYRIEILDSAPPPDPDLVSPLLLLLRKHVQGGRIVAVSQPPYERIVKITVAKPYGDETEAGDDPPALDGAPDQSATYAELIVELMGRRSNVILTNDAGRVYDALKRVTPLMSPARPMLPGKPYQPPPAQAKGDPFLATAREILTSSRGSTQPLGRWLVSAYLAVSPLLASEVAARAGLDADRSVAELTTADAERLASVLVALYSLLHTGQWEPWLYALESGEVLFSPIPLVSLPDDEIVHSQAYSSILEAAAAARAYDSNGETGRSSRHAVRRARLVQEIDQARERVQQRLRSLNDQVVAAESAEELRVRGEMIYAWLSQIEPGSASFTTPDGLRIELDPERTLVENAQHYFERYRKAKSADEQLPALVAQAERQLRELDQLRLMADQAASYDEIESIRQEWQAWAGSRVGVKASQRRGEARPSPSARNPRQLRLPSGDTILVGRTGRQNAVATFEIAGPADLWLHARDMPGAHVILRSPKPQADETALEAAASLAAYYSDGRNSTAVPVDITERRYVRKISGAGPGMVTYRNERTVQAKPRSEAELGLEPRAAAVKPSSEVANPDMVEGVASLNEASNGQV
jgi:predicted ribosome quality control (RQC) complex YloA/Tae2 family protein